MTESSSFEKHGLYIWFTSHPPTLPMSINSADMIVGHTPLGPMCVFQVDDYITDTVSQQEDPTTFSMNLTTDWSGFLNNILYNLKSEESTDSEDPADLFIRLVGELLSSSTSDFEHDKHILDIAQVLKSFPHELYKLNPLFYPTHLEFDIRHSHISYAVLQKPDVSYIYTLTPSHGLRFKFEKLSSLHLLDILISKTPGDLIYDYLHSLDLPPLFMGCLAQLAQDLLDQSNISIREREVLLKFLRRPGGQVPPSYVLYDVKNQTRFRETGLSDLKKGVWNNQEVVIKYSRRVRGDITNKEIVREIILIHQLQHPNIMSLLGVTFLAQQEGESASIGLVTMYMQHGNVTEFLKNNLSINRMTIVWQVSNGLQYLHDGFDFPVAHRDIKGENILVDDSLVCRLTDFGLSSIPALSCQSRMNKAAGTLSYLAPEVGDEIGVDLLKADIFSLGNTFIEIFTGRPVTLFQLHQLSKRKQTEHHHQHPTIPDFFWEIVDQMMNIDPNERPTIKIVRQAIEDNFDPPKFITIPKYGYSIQAPNIDERGRRGETSLQEYIVIRDIVHEWITLHKKEDQVKSSYTPNQLELQICLMVVISLFTIYIITQGRIVHEGRHCRENTTGS